MNSEKKENFKFLIKRFLERETINKRWGLNKLSPIDLEYSKIVLSKDYLSEYGAFNVIYTKIMETIDNFTQQFLQSFMDAWKFDPSWETMSEYLHPNTLKPLNQFR